MPPIDRRVSHHPFMAGDDRVHCCLPNCDALEQDAVHGIDRRGTSGVKGPAGFLLLESAKAISRYVDLGLISAAGTNTAARRALVLLDIALEQLGQRQTALRLSERAMADVEAQVKREDAAYADDPRGPSRQMADYQHRGQ